MLFYYLAGDLIISGGLGISNQIRGADRVQSGGPIFVNGGGITSNGGCGIGNNINCNGVIRSDDTTNATSVTSGALIAAGGLGIAKALYCNQVVANKITNIVDIIRTPVSVGTGTSINTYSLPAPAGVDQFIISLYGVSTTSTTPPYLRCGPSNPVATTNYVNVVSTALSTAVTDRIRFAGSWDAAQTVSGSIHMTKVVDGSNIVYVGKGLLLMRGSSGVVNVQLSSTFTTTSDVIYFELSAGAGNFDAGSWSIQAVL